MHAPGHLRDRFLELTEGGPDWQHLDPELVSLAGKLWTCTDTLPSGTCEDLGERYGLTYAQAARSIRKWARRHAAAGSSKV